MNATHKQIVLGLIGAVASGIIVHHYSKAHETDATPGWMDHPALLIAVFLGLGAAAVWTLR